MFMFRLALAQEYTTERVKLEAMRDKMVVDMEKKGINPKVCFWGISYIESSCSLPPSIGSVCIHRSLRYLIHLPPARFRR